MDIKPYLIIPQLVPQPTWGGSYIAETKGWEKRTELRGLKIGQSYEISGKSNLSSLTSTEDPKFAGEIIGPQRTTYKNNLENSFPLQTFIDENPEAVLGQKQGNAFMLLIKFTQALGNSFQLHIKDGVENPRWKPKPESWYFFEPGKITLGVKPTTDWSTYQEAVMKLDEEIQQISQMVITGKKPLKQGEMEIAAVVAKYDPWQYVNVVSVPKNTVIDLTPCGIHHSWEEDPTLPHGNIVYELQVDMTDEASTMRNFDKGKLTREGKPRELHINDYFTYIDRSKTANTPQTHIKQPRVISVTDTFSLTELFTTKYYTLKELSFMKPTTFKEQLDSFRHLFIKSGRVKIHGAQTTLDVTRGHSVFVPYGLGSYEIEANEPGTVVLISY